MIAYNCTVEQMERALSLVNKEFDNNIEWNRFDIVGLTIHFTLKCKDSSKSGHRLGQSLTSKGNRRKMVSACWHVHGQFFDSLICEVNQKATVKSLDKKLFFNGQDVENNWKDWNIGSKFSPLMASEACDC